MLNGNRVGPGAWAWESPMPMPMRRAKGKVAIAITDASPRNIKQQPAAAKLGLGPSRQPPPRHPADCGRPAPAPSCPGSPPPLPKKRKASSDFCRYRKHTSHSLGTLMQGSCRLAGCSHLARGTLCRSSSRCASSNRPAVHGYDDAGKSLYHFRPQISRSSIRFHMHHRYYTHSPCTGI